jgi:hypothetical protein
VAGSGLEAIATMVYVWVTAVEIEYRVVKGVDDGIVNNFNPYYKYLDIGNRVYTSGH